MQILCIRPLNPWSIDPFSSLILIPYLWWNRSCFPGLYIYGLWLRVEQQPAFVSTPRHPQYSPCSSRKLEIMENSKRSAEGAFDRSTSLRQRFHCQEGATHDAPTSSGYRADSVRPLGSSSSTIHYQLPCYPRWWIDNDDLLVMAKVLPNVFLSQNQPWPRLDVDRLPWLIRWTINWPRPRPESWVRYHKLCPFSISPSGF